MPQSTGADGEDGDREQEIVAPSQMRGEPAGDRQDDGVSGEITGNNPFAIGNGCGKPAGNVAQRHIGNRGIEHLHKSRHYHGERDEPRVEDSRAGGRKGCRERRRAGVHGRGANGSAMRRLLRRLKKFAGVRAGGRAFSNPPSA